MNPENPIKTVFAIFHRVIGYQRCPCLAPYCSPKLVDMIQCVDDVPVLHEGHEMAVSLPQNVQVSLYTRADADGQVFSQIDEI